MPGKNIWPSAPGCFSASTAAHFRLIEKRQQRQLARAQVAGFEPRELAVPVRDEHGGIKGKRKSKKDKLREAAALEKEKGVDDGEIDGA